MPDETEWVEFKCSKKEPERIVRYISALSNEAALCVGFDIATFDGLARRSVRVIRYKGTTRTRDAKREWEFSGGRLTTFEQAVRQFMTVTDQSEETEAGIRHQKSAFPEVAVREFLANCLVHHDLAQRDTNPMVEVFDKIDPWRLDAARNSGADPYPISRDSELPSCRPNRFIAGTIGCCRDREVPDTHG